MPTSTLPPSSRLGLVALALLCLSSLHAAHAQVRLEARPTEASAPAAGADGPIALTSERVDLRIDRQYVTATLEQTWTNQLDATLEGRALVSLGEGAQVTGFAYWNGEKKIVGEVFEKEVASAVYEQVTGQGRDPGLFEQVGEGTFTFRVFPIAPREDKRVQVRFGRLLTRRDNDVDLQLPLNGDARGALVDVTIDEERRIIDASGAGLTFERLGPTRVRLQGRVTGPSLRLRYTVDDEPLRLRATVHRDEGQQPYLLLSMAAPTLRATSAHPASKPMPKDITLVIDRSCSMGGEPLQTAIEAATAVVNRLGPTDSVNVIAFDDRAEQLFPAPRRADAETVRLVKDYLRSVRVGGGTDIARALKEALAAQAHDERPDVILFLTDGQSSAGEALAVAKADPGDARVFTVGLGSGVEKPLLSRLAAEKRGRFTFVADASTLETSMLRLFDRIERPLVVGLGVGVESRTATLMGAYPRTLPDLTQGEELVVAARIVGAGAMKLVVTGQEDGRPFERTVSIDVPAHVSHPWVGRTWAQLRVDDLLEEMALHGETPELKNEAVELALAYNLVTRYTSFLAIPEDEVTDEARATLASARERKQRIRDAHKDAVALSRSDMPPGDPLLTVKAPRSAKQVTAFFPFGLTQDLTWDERADAWRVRFLVPVDVPDGEYEATVVIRHADGSIEVAKAPYVIDSSAPDFVVEATPVAGGVRVKVTARQAPGLVTIARVDAPRERVVLRQRRGQVPVDTFEAFVALPSGAHTLRVVVADTARNEADQTVDVVVP